MTRGPADLAGPHPMPPAGCASQAGGTNPLKRDREAHPVDIITGDQAVDTAVATYSPGGHPYTMTVRPGTSDANTVLSCSGQYDEYDLPRGLDGWALDIGAHIGAATVPLLLDNPKLRVVAVEALPENVLQLVRNLERNGVSDRALVVHAAAGATPDDQVLGYGTDGTHDYIGNTDNPQGGRTVVVKGATLRGLMLLRGPDEDCPWRWAKIDCEGCEYGLLDSPWTWRLQYITGEVHRGWDRLVQLLTPTHVVTGPGQDFGPFQARLRPVDTSSGKVVGS